MIKCSCGDPECTTTIGLSYNDGNSASMYVDRKEPIAEGSPVTHTNEIMVYLDPNSIVKLIHELQDTLKKMIDAGGV